MPSVPPARSWTTCTRSGAKARVGVQMEHGTLTLYSTAPAVKSIRKATTRSGAASMF